MGLGCRAPAATVPRRHKGIAGGGWCATGAHLALALGLWALLSQPLVLLIHNAVPHTHPRVGGAESSSHADHDHAPRVPEKSPADEWCPILQGLKTLGLFLVPAARLAVETEVPAALVRLPYALEPLRAARRYNSQPRAPPRL